jgi:hypothetical protein
MHRITTTDREYYITLWDALRYHGRGLRSWESPDNVADWESRSVGSLVKASHLTGL